MNDTGGTPFLNALIGKRLEAVSFVVDYVTFQFEEFILDALANPTLIKNDEAMLFSTVDCYRAALEKLVGSKANFVCEEDTNLAVVLDSGITIFIPLDAMMPPGPEMATLSSKGRFVSAWCRPSVTRQ